MGIGVGLGVGCGVGFGVGFGVGANTTAVSAHPAAQQKCKIPGVSVMGHPDAVQYAVVKFVHGTGMFAAAWQHSRFFSVLSTGFDAKLHKISAFEEVNAGIVPPEQLAKKKHLKTYPADCDRQSL